MTKNEIADILSEIATLLELQGENPFKIRAYQSGARALEAIEAAAGKPLAATGRSANTSGGRAPVARPLEPCGP